MHTVADAMTTSIYTCKSSDTLDRAAKIMWEHGCSGGTDHRRGRGEYDHDAE